MFRKSLLIAFLSLGVLVCAGREASAVWKFHDHVDCLDNQSGDLGSGHRYELYFVYLSQGETVWLYQLSSQIDSYLYLVGPDGSTVAKDDDSAGGAWYSYSNYDAQLTYTAPVAGNYLVVASSYWPNELGYYRLWIYESDG